MKKVGLYYLALMVALSLSSAAYGKCEPNDPSKPQAGDCVAEATAETLASKEFSFPVRVVQSEEEAKRAESNEHLSREHEAKDLAAQQQSASAAERSAKLACWQTIIAVGQLIFSLAGTIAIVLTLAFNGKALKLASRSAETAIQTLVTERAWMCPKDITIDTIYDAIGPDGSVMNKAYGLSIIWSNCGRSPALNCTITTRGHGVLASHPRPTFPPISPEPEASVVGPGLDAMTKIHILDVKKLTALQNGHVTMYLNSICTYNDSVVGEKRRSEHTCVVEILDLLDGGKSSIGARMFAIGPQNSAT